PRRDLGTPRAASSSWRCSSSSAISSASNAAIRAFSRANVWSRSIHCAEESEGSNMSSMARTCTTFAAPVMESVIRLLYPLRHGKRTPNAEYVLIFHIIILEYLSNNDIANGNGILLRVVLFQELQNSIARPFL